LYPAYWYSAYPVRTIYLASIKGSFTATTSMSSLIVAIRITNLPILPNPKQNHDVFIHDNKRQKDKILYAEVVEQNSNYH
jgi:hypothetical protein